MGDRARLVVSARIDPDALGADNQAWAVVELRQELRVALCGAEGASGFTRGLFPGDGGELSPSQWLSLGLQPQGGDDPAGTIQVVGQRAGSLDDQALALVDAAIVHRPDLVTPTGWEALGDMARRGGVVWLIAPPTDSPAVWGAQVRQTFELDWDVGLEALQAPEVSPQEPSDHEDEVGVRGEGWGLATDGVVPEALQILGADWESLLRPVRVYRRLGLTIQGNAAGGDEVWLGLEVGEGFEVQDSGGDSPERGSGFRAENGSNNDTGASDPPNLNPEPRTPNVSMALLASGQVGRGSLLLLGTSVHTDWTNLPTKPLFVPLLHESLRGLVGRGGGGLSGVVCGDRAAFAPGSLPLGPDADREEAVAQRLVRIAEFIPDENDPPEAPRSVLLRRTDAGLLTIEALEFPGVYDAPPSARRALVVNVDPAGGDTRGVEPKRIEDWLSGVRGWQWLGRENPGSFLLGEVASMHIGFPLLWATLLLVLAETALARWFSHATVRGRSAIGERIMRFVRGSG